MTADTDPMALPFELYKMDFRGADELRVIEIDHTVEGKPRRDATITDAPVIARIVTLLGALPKRGPILKRLGPTVIRRIVAYRRLTPFAFVELYDGMLKTESTGFLGHGDERVRQHQAELSELVRGALP